MTSFWSIWVIVLTLACLVHYVWPITRVELKKLRWC